MNTVETTLPQPPSGVPNTEIPLAVTGTLTEDQIARDQLLLNQPLQDNNKWIFIESFPISENFVESERIFEWNSGEPLRENYVPKYRFPDSVVNQIIPRSLVLPHYARMGRISWELMFQPVKIGDCKVEIDFVFFYGAMPDIVMDNKTLNNDSIHYSVDGPEEVKCFEVPMYWPQHMVSLNVPIFNQEGQGGFSPTQFLPASYPKVYVAGYLRSRYIPNNLQRPEFKMLFFVRPIIQGLSGFAGRSPTSSIPGMGGSPILTYISMPYWYKILGLVSDKQSQENFKRAFKYFERDLKEFKAIVEKQSADKQAKHKAKIEKLDKKLKLYDDLVKTF